MSEQGTTRRPYGPSDDSDLAGGDWDFLVGYSEGHRAGFFSGVLMTSFSALALFAIAIWLF